MDPMATGRLVKKPNAMDPSPPTTAVAVIISRLIPINVDFIYIFLRWRYLTNNTCFIIRVVGA